MAEVMMKFSGEQDTSKSGVIGFNDVGIDKLILDIYSKMEKIKENLDQLSIIVEKSNAYFNSLNADLFNKKYDNFKVNYETFIKRISLYSSILLELKKRSDNKTSEMLAYIDVEKNALAGNDSGGN